MSEELLKLLETLEKPLIFASKNDFLNIDKVRNLDQLVDNLTIKALSLDLEPLEISAIEFLRESFDGYRELELENKKKLIKKSLKTLAELKSNRFCEKPYGSDLDRRTHKKEISDNKDLSQVPIQYVKGVGPKIAEVLDKRGIKKVEDLLYYIPRRYEDRRCIKKISALKPDSRETLMGTVILSGKIRTKTRELFQVVLSDGTGTIRLVWFQFSEKYLRATYKKGATVILSGDVTYGYNDYLQIIHPKPEDIEVIDDDKDIDKDFLNLNRIVPIYPLTEGIKQRRIRKIVKTVLDNYSFQICDYVPDEIKERNGLIGISSALSRVHFPEDSDRIVDLLDSNSVYDSVAHRTLSFCEFLLMELGLALKKRDVSKTPGIAFRPTGRLTENLLGKLPFSLTSAQKRVLLEIESDMRAESPMNRLLQGDVGSGKTIVALLSMLKAVECGNQVALMAPTEILAEQHLKSILQYTERVGLRVVLLKSGLSREEKETYYEARSSGQAEIIVGTHALIEERVEFKNLGFVVIDEQHRFGVLQRAELKNKGLNPDVLVMTATPIPRTLAMTVYGDLDVSVLDEMPPDRKQIKTVVFYEEEGAREKAYETVSREIQRGRQVYIVYPMIDESESPDFKDLKYATQMAEELQNNIFRGFRVGLLHGRMKTEEKEVVMRRFVAHDLDILVSTTVIEVGVDVANATVMVVENAERFGLSQLHQLRGRIGRGVHESVCILISASKRSEDAEKRLAIVEKTSDGFRIAEADLMIRGPGDFLGTKQSGLPEFKFADLIRDARILCEAREEAFRIVREDNKLSKYPLLLTEAIKKWGEKLELAGVS